MPVESRDAPTASLTELIGKANSATDSIGTAIHVIDYPSSSALPMTTMGDTISPHNLVRNRNDNDQIEMCKQKFLQSLKQFDDDALVIDCKNKSQFLQTRSQRGSRYRGVSKNGGKWQVMIVKKSIKKYIGAVHSEE